MHYALFQDQKKLYNEYYARYMEAESCVAHLLGAPADESSGDQSLDNTFKWLCTKTSKIEEIGHMLSMMRVNIRPVCCKHTASEKREA